MDDAKESNFTQNSFTITKINTLLVLQLQIIAWELHASAMGFHPDVFQTSERQPGTLSFSKKGWEEPHLICLSQELQDQTITYVL